MRNKPKLYYAHSKVIYNTDTETQTRVLLRKLFPKFQVVCPNQDLGELGTLQPYLDYVGTCQLLVATEYKQFVGKGVFEEVQFALSKGIDALVLRTSRAGRPTVHSISRVQVVDPRDWRLMYGKVIATTKYPLADRAMATHDAKQAEI